MGGSWAWGWQTNGTPRMGHLSETALCREDGDGMFHGSEQSQ